MNSDRNLTKDKKINLGNFKISKTDSFKKLIILVFIFTLIFPISTNAVDVGSVPVKEGAYRAKETGPTICAFGFCSPPVPFLTWDYLGTVVARQLISSMMRETSAWIRNGFEGRPSYATDPAQFFTDLADNVAGDFLLKSDLGFLCTPFDVKIRAALNRSITRQVFQCRFTQAVANLEAFTNNFTEGSWDDWFVLTQNDRYNQYGAIVQGQIELDNRIAQAIGVQRQQLSWDSGYLSWSECKKWEELPGPTQDGQPLRGKCLIPGPVKTPGTMIETELANQLGSGIRQLELADEFDELVSALLGALILNIHQATFGEDGFF